MEEVIRHLETKNRYYEKFYQLTVQFLSGTNADKWDGLELFVGNRERILNIIRSYDYKIARQFNSCRNIDVRKYHTSVQGLLGKRGDWIKKIVELDLELIEKIDDMKSETIRELKKKLESHQRMASFEREAPKLRHRA